MTIHDAMVRLNIGALLLVVLVGCQSEPAPQVPAEVRAAVVRQMAEVGIDARQVDQATGLFKPVDLSAQAAPDWLVDFNVLPSGQLCGTGGCPLQVWVKIGPAPYALTFDRQTLGHEVVRHGSSRRWLGVDLHGALCGETGSSPCKYAFEWRGDADAKVGHFAAASIWGKPTRYVGPLVQAMSVQSPSVGPVAEVLATYRTACTAAGGAALMDDALIRLPDLNRDGRPELLFDASLADCQRDDEPVAMNCTSDTCKSRLFTERGAQGWRVAWSGEPFAYTVDFSQPESRLLIRKSDCTDRCPEQPMLWQDNQLQFTFVSP